MFQDTMMRNQGERCIHSNKDYEEHYFFYGNSSISVGYYVTFKLDDNVWHKLQ